METEFEVPVSKVWMAATDAAQTLGVSRQQLNKLIKNGLFPSTEKVGTSYNLKIEEVEHVRKEREVAERLREEKRKA